MHVSRVMPCRLNYQRCSFLNSYCREASLEWTETTYTQKMKIKSCLLAAIAKVIAKKNLHAQDGIKVVDQDYHKNKTYQPMEQHKQSAKHITETTFDLKQSEKTTLLMHF